MVLHKSLIVAAIAGITLLADTVAVPVLSADTEPNLPSEARGCGDLRDAMTGLLKARKELGEAAERVKGDENQEAIQKVLNATKDSITRTDSIMDKLSCVKKDASSQPTKS